MKTLLQCNTWKLRRFDVTAAVTAAAICLAVSSAAHAKLPAPPAADPAKAAVDAEKAKTMAAEEQAALARAQDRVVTGYQSDLRKRGMVPPTPTPVAPTAQANLPAKAVEPPRSAGPQGGTRPSAEAHSGNMK